MSELTNLELAAQQGSQSAPKLLDAVNAGELGGGGSTDLMNADFYVRFITDTNTEATTATPATLFEYTKRVVPRIDMLTISIQTGTRQGSPINVCAFYLSSKMKQTLIDTVTYMNRLEGGVINPDAIENLPTDELITTTLNTIFALKEMCFYCAMFAYKKPNRIVSINTLNFSGQDKIVYTLSEVATGNVDVDFSVLTTPWCMQFIGESIYSEPIKIYDEPFYSSVLQKQEDEPDYPES